MTEFKENNDGQLSLPLTIPQDHAWEQAQMAASSIVRVAQENNTTTNAAFFFAMVLQILPSVLLAAAYEGFTPTIDYWLRRNLSEVSGTIRNNLHAYNLPEATLAWEAFEKRDSRLQADIWATMYACYTACDASTIMTITSLSATW